jgi:hypothetical protein
MTLHPTEKAFQIPKGEKKKKKIEEGNKREANHRE